jgi:beta-N-acetylhexosaminidase
LPNNTRPRPIIFGCAGTVLTPGERNFFSDINPFGFILFQRNCQSRDQVRQLIADLRATVGRDVAPILIDQEGGRVARLKPPNWPKYPAARIFGQIWESDHQLGVEAVKIHATLMGHELARLGVTVNCAPVLDLSYPITHDAIGDRAFSAKADAVIALGRAFAEGLLEAGVLPVIKHMPGHGRATVDPHLSLPFVEADTAALEVTDMKPFMALKDFPIGMTCHLMFKKIDPVNPVSLSSKIISDLIRGKIGFDGLLFSDDLDMKALTGRLEDRGRDALAAGNDVLLYCSPDQAGMVEIGRGLPAMNDLAWARWQRAMDRLPKRQPFIDIQGLNERLDIILGAAAASA